MGQRGSNTEVNENGVMRRCMIYSPPDTGVLKSRIMRWAGRVACMGKMQNVSRIFVGRPGGLESLGRQ